MTFIMVKKLQKLFKYVFCHIQSDAFSVPINILKADNQQNGRWPHHNTSQLQPLKWRFRTCMGFLCGHYHTCRWPSTWWCPVKCFVSGYRECCILCYSFMYRRFRTFRHNDISASVNKRAFMLQVFRAYMSVCDKLNRLRYVVWEKCMLCASIIDCIFKYIFWYQNCCLITISLKYIP